MVTATGASATQATTTRRNNQGAWMGRKGRGRSQRLEMGVRGQNNSLSCLLSVKFTFSPSLLTRRLTEKAPRNVPWKQETVCGWRGERRFEEGALQEEMGAMCGWVRGGGFLGFVPL